MPMSGDHFRRAAAEFVGTFAFVFVVAGAVVFARTLTDLALASGFVIAAMMSAVGFISGGHFNPAVTLGFVVTRRISFPLAVIYWITQLVAAIAAAALLKWVIPDAAAGTTWHVGAPSLGQGVDAGQAVVIEAVLTFFIVWVFFATAADPRGAFRQIAGLGVGFTYAFAVMIGYVLTGGVFNPARAFGSELIGNEWANAWVWYLGPFAGAAVAAVLYELLFLRPESPVPPVGTAESELDELAPGDAAAS